MPKATTRKEGWTKVAFGDVVSLSSERLNSADSDVFERFIGLEHIVPGDLHISHWGDVADGTSFTSVFRPGQVLFGKRRAYQRKVAVAEFSGVCSSDIYVLEPKGRHLLPGLLPFICLTDAFFEHAIGTSAGSLSPRTNWTSLASFEFTLPHIDEQRRIVTTLAAVEKTGHALRRLAEAVRSAELALAGDLFPPPSKSTGVRLAKFAKEDIKKVRVNPKTTYRTAGVLNEGRGLFEKHQLLGSKTKYEQLIVLGRNQLVMRKLTAWEGAIAVVPEEFEGAVVSTEFPTVTIDEEVMLPHYMSWVLRQPWFWREMKSRCKGTALRRSRLHQRDLLQISVRVPNIEEQHRALDHINAARAATDEARARAERLGLVLESSLRVLLMPSDTKATEEDGTRE